MVIIEDCMSFMGAWQALMDGKSVAFAYWKKGQAITKIDGFIYLIDYTNNNIRMSWRPDPVEMVQDYWMIVR